MKALREIFTEIAALAQREWRLILGNRKLRSLMLLAPLLNALIVCGVYAPSYVTDVPIAVVQQDQSALSQRMIRWLDQHQKVRVTQTLSDVSEADALLKAGAIAAYVVFEKDFSQRLKRNEDARVLLFCDATNMVVANTISAATQGVVQTFSAGLSMNKARKLGAFKEQAQALASPIRAEIRPLGNPSFSYADFMLPGMLLTVLQQVILLALALSWAGERESMTLAELRSLSQRFWVILLGKNLPHFVIHSFWLFIFLSVVLPLSSVSSEAQFGSLVLFSMLFVLVMLGWGTWVSLAIGDRLGATQALMFLSVPSFILSGYTWPSASLPLPLQVISQILPLTHSAVMIRKIYGLGLEITAFPRELTILGAFVVLHILASWWTVRRMMRAEPASRA
ncbi:MAG TPA: ABC transporter permease [Oligoflexus sp.]|uniref:ABC transporter permease n=1 Tax=Oligoflexus sp. TaxID=1971216 RepID=UPI002D7EBDB7|nr:ABC transporter permease [Oligoflexus sp.]HET9235862.1 ABC transporter permease [Oligoflexus sp.]